MLMQFSATDTVIQEKGLKVKYMHIIVQEIRKFLTLPCETRPGRYCLIKITYFCSEKHTRTLNIGFDGNNKWDNGNS